MVVALIGIRIHSIFCVQDAAQFVCLVFFFFLTTSECTISPKDKKLCLVLDLLFLQGLWFIAVICMYTDHIGGNFVSYLTYHMLK